LKKKIRLHFRQILCEKLNVWMIFASLAGENTIIISSRFRNLTEELSSALGGENVYGKALPAR
jgi:hypothetical protein